MMMGPMAEHRNPYPTVDIIIELDGKIVLIERKFPPHGWAIPGGFVEVGETLAAAARREAKEETSLDVSIYEMFHSYSDPARDPRHHTISTVFLATATGTPRAEDDAAGVALYTERDLPPLAFDHAAVLADYFAYKASGRRPSPER
jgi:8-oxo-dGTP diphosphatase